MIQSSHMTKAKTEAQEEKVVCPRSYSKTLGELGHLCTHKATSPAITREETHEKISKFHHDHEKSAYTSSETHRKFSSPHQGEDMRILRSEEAASPELSQRWGQWAGKLCLTMEEFLNSVSQTKQTTGYLFSRTRERSHLHWPAIFVAFLLQKQEPLFKFTSVQGWKYKQTLLLSLVQSQAIKQALEISNLIRKKKKPP